MAQRVVVTGASSGIGRGLAVALAPGNHLLIHGQNRERLAETASLCGAANEIRSATSDLTMGFDSLLAEFAHLKSAAPIVLVHCAGVFFPQPLADMPLDRLHKTLALNLTAPIELTHTLWPRICEVGGKVLFVSSVAASTAFEGSTVYGASKAGLSQFARTLALEAPPTVGVHVFEPGPIDTPLWQRQSFRPDGMMSVDDLVDSMLRESGLR
ncbi:MAG: SDR family oxidoreductase [Chthonomonas sp.]|nr:SDR family oxidoreductase [Chthonomonas sp.]